MNGYVHASVIGLLRQFNDLGVYIFARSETAWTLSQQTDSSQ
jgi:hypothetical protein